MKNKEVHLILGICALCAVVLIGIPNILSSKKILIIKDISSDIPEITINPNESSILQFNLPEVENEEKRLFLRDDRGVDLEEALLASNLNKDLGLSFLSSNESEFHYKDKLGEEYIYNNKNELIIINKPAIPSGNITQTLITKFSNNKVLPYLSGAEKLAIKVSIKKNEIEISQLNSSATVDKLILTLGITTNRFLNIQQQESLNSNSSENLSEEKFLNTLKLKFNNSLEVSSSKMSEENGSTNKESAEQSTINLGNKSSTAPSNTVSPARPLASPLTASTLDLTATPSSSPILNNIMVNLSFGGSSLGHSFYYAAQGNNNSNALSTCVANNQSSLCQPSVQQGGFIQITPYPLKGYVLKGWLVSEDTNSSPVLSVNCGDSSYFNSANVVSLLDHNAENCGVWLSNIVTPKRVSAVFEQQTVREGE